MKLFYRGVSYEVESSTIEVTEGEIGGMYRGQAWRTHTPKESHRIVAPVELTYRGAAYKR